MIIYLAARLVSWLYGLDWPPGRSPSGADMSAVLASFSAISMPFEIFAAIMLSKSLFGRKKKVGAK